MPTAGMASAVGISFEIVKQADMYLDSLRAFQGNFEKELGELLPLLLA